MTIWLVTLPQWDHIAIIGVFDSEESGIHGIDRHIDDVWGADRFDEPERRRMRETYCLHSYEVQRLGS